MNRFDDIRFGKLISGLLLPPIPAVFVAFLPLAILDSPEGSLLNWLGPSLFVALLGGAFIGYPAMLVLGLPAHVILCANNRRGFFYYCFAGLVAGLLTVFILSAIDNRLYDFFLPLGAVAGIFSGFFFWLIRRPDRDAPNPPTHKP